MTKLFLSAFSGLLLSSIVLAQPAAQPIETDSLFNSALYINAINNSNNQPKVATEVRKPYSHESERGNSLFRAALAIQGVKENLHIDKSSRINYSRYTETNEKEKNNSLFHGALAK